MNNRFRRGILATIMLVAVAGGSSLAGMSEAYDTPPFRQQDLAAGNNAFAFDLYHAVRAESDNVVFSPYSISLALAMTYAGARGSTETQMAETLHFMLPQETLHPAFKALNESLPREAEDADAEDDDSEAEDERFRLNIANALWGQEDFPFRDDFVALLSDNYGAGLQLVNFAADAEAARQQINTWVSEQTEGRIEDLIPPDAINALTRLVLTNAVYFKAAWLSTFEPEVTQDGPFSLLDGTAVTVPLMVQEETYAYASGEGYQAVLLPYEGDRMGMVILLPALDQFDAFEDALDADRFAAIVSGLAWEKVQLTMPRFEIESSFGLADTLIALGMPDAFNPDAADFTGMADTTDPLFISAVIHKAFITVDESGTEAAAATAVIMETMSAPVEEEPVVMRVDHPFIYAIYDQETRTILFLGRVLNPA